MVKVMFHLKFFTTKTALRFIIELLSTEVQIEYESLCEEFQKRAQKREWSKNTKAGMRDYGSDLVGEIGIKFLYYYT